MQFLGKEIACSLCSKGIKVCFLCSVLVIIILDNGWEEGFYLFICLLILIPLMKLLWGQQSCRQSVLRSHWVSLLCGCTENPGQRDAVDSALPRSLWELSAPQRLLPRPCSGGTFPADLLQVCSTTCPLLGFAVKTSRREGAASGSPELDRSHHPASN